MVTIRLSHGACEGALKVDPAHGGSDVSHPIQGRWTAELAMRLLVMSLAEPHDAAWVVVVDVMALGWLSAADLARLRAEATFMHHGFGPSSGSCLVSASRTIRLRHRCASASA